MLALFKKIGNSFADLLYPPFCLHCDESLGEGYPLFCESCLKLMTFIDPIERCPFCFSAEIDPQQEKCCTKCSKTPPTMERMAAVFDYEGPAASLIKHLKYGGQPHLAKGAGAYLAAQFLQLEWPMPDCIIPMPMSYLRRMERGYNQSLLLAQSLAGFIGSPVVDVLRRRGGDYSQAGLNHHQRLQLQNNSFTVKKGIKLYDKCVLVIDDVMTTGSSLRCCGEALLELCPQNIYALTVCRAL